MREFVAHDIVAPRPVLNRSGRLRIIHVVRQFPPSVGGLENFVLSLAQEQQKQGHDVSILTLNRIKVDAKTVLPAEDVIGGVPVRRIGFVGSFRYPIAPSVVSHIRNASVVHVHAVDFLCDFLALTRFWHRKPLVLTTHGGFFHTQFALPLKKLFFAAVTPLSMRGYDRVLACSSQDFELFRPVTPAATLTLLDNGVDTKKFRDTASKAFKPSFLYIGRFAVNKGLDRLIEAFGEIARRIPEARLHIAGNDWGGLLPALREQIARTAGGDRVEITLDASDEDIRRLASECSFFASASHYEAFGLTTIEGMSAGLIPVTSNIDSFRSVIEPAGVGMTADFSDPAAAGRAIADYVLSCEPRYGELRAKAMAVSRQYDWAIVAERTTREYQRILDGRPEAATA